MLRSLMNLRQDCSLNLELGSGAGLEAERVIWHTGSKTLFPSLASIIRLSKQYFFLKGTCSLFFGLLLGELPDSRQAISYD